MNTKSTRQAYQQTITIEGVRFRVVGTDSNKASALKWAAGMRKKNPGMRVRVRRAVRKGKAIYLIFANVR